MSTAASDTAPSADAPKGHPLGLYFLFGTEMWERFSYYGMRALLVLYMINQFGWQPSDASTVYKWYTSLVYLTPLLGGYLADRYLGLRLSIIIGGVLMAIGHFLMAFEPLTIFYAALGFLVAGNGFFKPNISTLVGRMYTANDARRDGAFTIFYMGINLGAFLAPLVCGEWLRANYGFHYGFTAAGVGMMLGLISFLVGQKRILADVAAAGNSLAIVKAKAEATKSETKEAEDARREPDEKEPGAGGFAGILVKVWPILLLAIAAVVPVRSIYLASTGALDIKDAVMMSVFAAIAGIMAITLFKIGGKARDKSTVIFILFLFSVLFWMAFEQAGNALNIWAEYNTDKTIGSFSYSAESFQSLNPLLIFILAPVFSVMWVGLARRNKNPSTPAKFLMAMIFMVLSFGAMVGAGLAESAQVGRAPLDAVPAGINVSELNAGRGAYDEAKKELEIRGVFPTFAVIDAYTKVVDPKFAEQLGKLDEGSKEASAEKPIQAKLENLPATFELKVDSDELKKCIANFDAATSTITITGSLGAEGKRALLGAAAPPSFRAAVESIAKANEAGRVSGFWLFLSYLLATIGELCLSPVGLSMVTKLAPQRYGSLFMGVWLLASSVAQYMGGTLGELWGTIPPTTYFEIFVATSVIGAVLLVVLVSPVRKAMHGVT